MSQLNTPGGQSIGVSTSRTVLPMNIQDWSPLRLTGLISLQPKVLSRVFSNTTIQNHQLFSGQLSLQSNSHIHIFSSVQSLSHVQLFVTPMDCSTAGFPVLHHLPEFTQTHVHWVSDAIQPSHLLSFSPLPALNLSQHQGLLKWVSPLHQVAKVLEFQLQHQTFQCVFRTDFF